MNAHLSVIAAQLRHHRPDLTDEEVFRVERAAERGNRDWPKGGELRWFPLMTYPQAEGLVTDWLAKVGLDYYAPTFSETRRYRGKLQAVEAYFVPTYVFLLKPDEISFSAVRSLPGVSEFVKVSGEPFEIPQAVMLDFQGRIYELAWKLQGKKGRKKNCLFKVGDRYKLAVEDDFGRSSPYGGLTAVIEKIDPNGKLHWWLKEYGEASIRHVTEPGEFSRMVREG